MWINTDGIVDKILEKTEKGTISKFWKKITNIDESKGNGFAFEGELLQQEKGIQDVKIEIENLILVYRKICLKKFSIHSEIAICEITKYDDIKKEINFNIITKKNGGDWAGQILSDKNLLSILNAKLNKTYNIREKLESIIKKFQNDNNLNDNEIKELLKNIIDKEE